jgi:hypothetical protein
MISISARQSSPILRDGKDDIQHAAIDFLFLPIFIGTRANNYAVTYLLFLSQAPLTSGFGSTNIMEIGRYKL